MALSVRSWKMTKGGRLDARASLRRISFREANRSSWHGRSNSTGDFSGNFSLSTLCFSACPVRKDGALTSPFLERIAASPEGLLARREDLFISFLPKIAGVSTGVKVRDA